MIQSRAYETYLTIALVVLACGLFELLLPRWGARLTLRRIVYRTLMAIRRKAAEPLSPKSIRNARRFGAFLLILSCVWLVSLHPQVRWLSFPLYEPGLQRWQAVPEDRSYEASSELERLDQVTRAALTPQRMGSCVGMCVGVVHGERTYLLQVGRKNIDSAVPPDADTLFEIGSITKTFTCAALAGLAGENVVRLDAPVEQLLPGWSVPERDGRKITLNDLATHRSGLPRMPGGFMWSGLVDGLLLRGLANPYRTKTADYVKGYLAGYTLQRAPGTTDEYSNLGVGLLGYALGQKAGMPYAELIRQRILDPLQMTDTFVNTLAAHDGAFAQGYAGPISFGKFSIVFPVGNWQFADGFQGCGAIVSNVKDMLKYVRANIAAPEGPLGKRLALVQQPQFDVKGIKNCKIGLALMSMKVDGLDEPMYWHNGGTGGYNSFMAFLKEHKAGVVMLATGPCNERLGVNILKELARP